MHALLQWFRLLIVSPPHAWHPVIVHFPIAFLFTEAWLLARRALSERPDPGRASGLFLRLSLGSMVPVAVAGLHDAGFDLGPGNLIWLGLVDRWKNLFRFRSSISAHVMLILLVFLLATLRLVIRARAGCPTPKSARAWLELGLATVGLALLTVAGYAGGSVSHP